MENNQIPLSEKLNLETARAPWKELQTFFANGLILHVKSSQDLLVVAEQISADNAPLLKQWLDDKTVQKVTDEQALTWYEADAELWTVVIKPWVIVQEEVVQA
jgi:hypothetical protein